MSQLPHPAYASTGVVSAATIGPCHMPNPGWPRLRTCRAPNVKFPCGQYRLLTMRVQGLCPLLHSACVACHTLAFRACQRTVYQPETTPVTTIVSWSCVTQGRTNMDNSPTALVGGWQPCLLVTRPVAYAAFWLVVTATVPCANRKFHM